MAYYKFWNHIERLIKFIHIVLEAIPIDPIIPTHNKTQLSWVCVCTRDGRLRFIGKCYNLLFFSKKKNNNNNNLWFDNRSQIHLFACWRSSTNHVTINFRKYLFHTYNTHSPLLHKNHHDPKNYVCVIIFLKTIEFFL